MSVLAFLSPDARAAIEALIEETVARQLADRERDLTPLISPYMTIPEAAEYLRCRRQRIDDLLSSGRLTRIKEGRRTLVLRQEVMAYLQERHRR